MRTRGGKGGGAAETAAETTVVAMAVGVVADTEEGKMGKVEVGKVGKVELVAGHMAAARRGNRCQCECQ